MSNELYQKIHWHEKAVLDLLHEMNYGRKSGSEIREAVYSLTVRATHLRRLAEAETVEPPVPEE